MAALDIGGTKVAGALVEGERLLWRGETPMPEARTPEAVSDLATELLGPFLSDAECLGVAVTGRVVGGVSRPLNRVTLPGWDGFDVKSAFSSRTGLETSVLNDARAAAWGEYLYGAGRGASEFMFVTVSTGVGAGLVLGGRLHITANGLEAELGFTLVDGVPLEHVASGTALGKAAADLGLESVRDLADAAEGGDLKADTPYLRSAEALAAKLADAAVLLGVTRVALGGGVGLRAGYLSRVRDALSALPSVHRPDIVQARLGKNAGLVGAAAFASAGASRPSRV